MPTIPIGAGDGDGMPALGLGTWKAPRGEVGAAVQAALELGYRHIDCASIYGNEAEIGVALQEALGRGALKRQELWITSKLWNDCHAPEQVRPALERSLKALGLEWLDLYLIHWPVAQKPGVMMPQRVEEQIPLEQMPLADTWRAMEELADAGLVRHVGVSNFSVHKLRHLLEGCRRKPEVNQVERHPWLQQNGLMQFCREEAIAVTAYSPLGSAESGQVSPFLQDPQVLEIAAEHRWSAAQVLLAWGIACGTSVIPKSVRRERLAENLDAAAMVLTAEDMTRLNALDRHQRLVDGSFWDLPGGPYPKQNLWDE